MSSLLDKDSLPHPRAEGKGVLMLYVYNDLKIVVEPHVEDRIAERGGALPDVLARVIKARHLPEAQQGRPLALRKGPVVPVVEFRQRRTRAVVATVLTPNMVLKPGTIPVEV